MGAQAVGVRSDPSLRQARRILAPLEKEGVNTWIALMSGGKDSLVAAHVMHRLGRLHGVVFVDTTIGLRETREFVERTCGEFGWSLHVVTPKTCYEDFVMKYGFPKAPLHSAVMRELKWKPLRTYFRQHADRKHLAFVSGTRRLESRRRFRLARPTSRSDGMAFAAPIFEIPTEEVWKYIDQHSLPLNPVYQTLHLSGDCLCGAYSRRSEAGLIAAFHPEIARKIRDLEARCHKVKYNTWGNGPSMAAAVASKEEQLVCGECQGIGPRQFAPS